MKSHGKLIVYGTVISYSLLVFIIGFILLKMIDAFFPLSPIVFWTIFIVLSLFSFLTIFTSKHFNIRFYNTSYKIGSYWLILMLYATAALPVIILIRFILGENKFEFFTYRNFYIYAIIIFFTLYAILALTGTFNASFSKIKNYEIIIDKYIKEPINIVMISDIHLGNIIRNKRLKKMVQTVNSLNPDIIAIAGDIVDSNITPFTERNMAEEFSHLKSKYGTYAVLGNHDLMTKSIDKIIKILSENKVTVLRDDAILIDNSFYIIGRDDITIKLYTKKNRKPLIDITKNLDNSKPLILIDHNPKDIKESYNANIDLQLSGHTHKGQISPLNFVTKRAFEIDYGHLQKNNFNVIVSSGYGTWGPPIRLGSKSEIVVIKLKGK
ncbi:metallophosphoesterase [Clostridium isatidis]|uniref:Metallophosphoesterase n=1 Tax=Clostridium isatidis TaxID=182773 RepID=A0A343JBZ8_9CLOT|nr:metallophosphoesterase [Clostridium isatidis]ASW43056.1 metallophosphoesterase [Clostridium isatidis]